METNKKTSLYATYEITSYWELDFDLSECIDWYVRHDTLFAKFNKTSEYQEFQPTENAYEDYGASKEPIRTELSTSPY